ncbi:MAG TPA: tetratricopeptide repeat protein [Anaeromyxobacter sp.]|nr:tetratricopeptide repeat protein [Anaeromyxobacter sp.]
MPERFQWRSPGDPTEGPDSIAGELASRIEALPAAPGDAMDWAAIAAALEREAEALGARPAAAQLLYEVGRIYEEHLADPAGALEFHRRAVGLDPGFLPNLRACRRLAMDRGEDALAADALEAEAAATPEPSARAELLLLRGRLLAGLGRAAEAREVIARAAAAAPGSFAVAEEEALQAAAAGDRAGLAEAYVRCARAAADRRLSAHYLSAASALLEEGLGEPDRAGALAFDAFELLPHDPLLRAAARRHAERLRRDDVLAAVLQAEAAASAGGAAADAWHALARLEERLGRPEGAIAALEHARAAAPSDPGLLADLARLREERRAYADAAEALDALAAAHLAREDAGHVRAAILAKLRRAELEEVQLGRPHLAAECCRDVLEVDPRNRVALAALGRICARLGDWEGLLAAFEAEARSAADPRERALRTFKGAEVLEERLGRVDDAIARYREALALDPDLAPARSAVERLCEAEGRWEHLCALLEGDLDGLRSPAERAATLFRVARIREDRLRDLDGASRAYARALEIEPGNRSAAAALSATLLRLGRHDEVAELLLRDARDAAEPRRRLAALQRRAELVEEHSGDPQRARSAWEDVLAEAPLHLAALRALGRLHSRAGRWEELAAMYRAEAGAVPDAAQAADVVHRAGEILERRLGRVDDAIAAYREALTLAPAHALALQALARLYRARGDDENVVEILRAQAAAHPPPDERARLLSEAARIAEERLGDRQRAIDTWEDALRADPGHAPARRALDRLYAETGRAQALAALRRAPGAAAAGEDAAERLLRLARLEADRVGDSAAALRATEDLLSLAPADPSGLLLELRLAPDAARRARARARLAGTAEEPGPRAALLAAAALEAGSPQARREGLAAAAALAPASAALAPEEERRLRASDDPAALARFCEARRDAARDPASRACAAVQAGEAWERAGDADRALAAFQAALEALPSSLAALRGARVLFARRGDWAAVRGTLQAEGAALRDGHGAALAWLGAGEIAERRFADPEAAVADYRRAAERDPLDPEPLRRLEALLGERGASDIAAVHEARARAEGDARRAAESWLAAARTALDGEDGRAAALAAVDRALEARADLFPALELRARLLAADGRHAEALADLEACLAHGGEPAARLLVHLAAAAVCDDGLRDPGRALPHLTAALALAPENPEALARLARVRAAGGRIAEAAAALRRLVEVPGIPGDALREHLLALADLDERLGSREGAVSACRRALALDPASDEAHRRLVRLEAASGDPRARVASLEAAGAHARDPAFRTDCLVEAARLLGGELQARDRAVARLRAALELDPARDDVRAALADLLEDGAPAEAVREHRRLLRAAPTRLASWAALYRQFERTRAHDRACVAASALRWLGAPAPGPAAERLLLEADRQVLGEPPQLGAEDLALLRAPGDDGPLSALVEAAGDAVAAAAAGVGPEGAPARDHPLRRPFGDLARALGAPEWELHAGAIGRVDVEVGAPWVVRVGPDVARRSTAREQRFLLARAAARLRTRGALASLPPAELEAWILAAIRVVVPGHAPGGPADEGRVRQLAKRLSRRARRAVEEPARALAAPPAAPDLDAWRAASAATADRAGLVLCGDLSAAIAVLAREGTPRPTHGAPTPAPTRETASTLPRVLAVLAFAASEEHLALRQRLRVAIA